ncbi:hypothetical protein K450DRAFT_233131 [Umbelopsis ramanniana AG]|uniref:Uncharacterized protein n=1 Tax=Umbelopsis ramanniana AG TaxID=1314678 RepID=A0AAD5HEH2_UMBRA|nr:uncharacterized protein K450DRAFT_233131 [Umbelopsis ramanniana AG]KAI8581445.1 hypothetical protein K450DRAFT_233131 [Umbelopsis ramanniana AG]
MQTERASTIAHLQQENSQHEEALSRKSSLNARLVDIRGRAVGDSVLVALLDRSRDMEDLVSRNTDFFEVIEHHIRESQGKEAWDEFKHIMFSPRETVPDGPWLDSLVAKLDSNPTFIAKFYEIVGYDVYDSDSEPEDEAENRGGNLHLNRQEVDSEADDDLIDLRQLRNYPDLQQQLPDAFPAFFRNVKHCLSQGCSSDAISIPSRRNSVYADSLADDVDVDVAEVRHQNINVDAEGDYETFISVLKTSRREQPNDDKWQEEIFDSLEGWPNLLEELKEIVTGVYNAREIQ